MCDFPPEREVSIELSAFYALVHVDWLLDKALSEVDAGRNMVSLLRLKERTVVYRQCMEYALSRIIFDYLFLACLGEARNANGHAGVALSLFNRQFTSSTSRITAVSCFAGQYAPSEALPKLIELFKRPDWAHGFGGCRWAELARTALCWWNHEWTDIVLIDHCVDLVHNNGLAFDKGFLLKCCWSADELLGLLDDKSSDKPLWEWRTSSRVGGCVFDLLSNLQRLGVLGGEAVGYAYCPLCGTTHRIFHDRENILTGSYTERSCKTLADDGYSPIAWPKPAEANAQLGSVVQVSDLVVEESEPGCDLNYHTACDHQCETCGYNYGGCEYNAFSPCNGKCTSCEFYHAGCAANGYTQCHGLCHGCAFEKQEDPVAEVPVKPSLVIVEDNAAVDPTSDAECEQMGHALVMENMPDLAAQNSHFVYISID